MLESARDLLGYIDASPTPYHAVAETVRRLETSGSVSLQEHDPWQLQPGARHHVTRNDGSILAFEIGTEPPHDAGFRLIGAHTDSPNLRVKPAPDTVAHGCRQLRVEPYGGVLLHTWLDRDLSLAGRVTLRRPDGLATELVDFGRPLLRIPNLAIHLQREIRDDGLKLNAQSHMAPLLGLAPAPEPDDGCASGGGSAHGRGSASGGGSARGGGAGRGGEPGFVTLLATELSSRGGEEVDPAQIVSWEMMTYDVQPSAIGGMSDELIMAPRLDNLASCHAATTALTAAAAAGPAAHTRVVVLYDHEEVGSRSAHGADGPFLLHTLERICRAGGGDAQSLSRALAQSTLVSADMAHAVHPNYANRHEPGHRPVLGAGPVIKTNVNLSYASDAGTIGLFVDLCRRREIEPQHFAVRSDLPCGSTIGPITAARVGVRTVDVGNPMLAMHSCRETAATADVEPMISVLTDYLVGD